VAARLIAWLLACRGDPPLRLVEADPWSVADPERVRFAALGDAGKANATQRRVGEAVVRHCAERGCDFVVLLGDLVYPRGLDGPRDPDAELRIVAPYRDAGVPVVAVLGNHDYAHGGDRQRAGYVLEWAADRDDVVLPGHAWHATAGPAVVIGLDTADAIRFGAEPQLGWLRGVLGSIDDEAWVIGLGHHPRWSDGPHGNAGAYEGWRGIPWMSGGAVRRLLDVLDTRADIYLAGHDHSRQLIDHGTMVQIVSGGGATATRILDRGNRPRFAEATPGFVWLELRDDGGTVEFVDARGVVGATLPLDRR